MTPQITAAGLRAYADFVEQHPEIPAEPEFTVYGPRNSATVPAILNALPDAVIRVEQGHNICYIDAKFGEVPVHFVVWREMVAMPIIQDGKVVWVVKPELEAVAA